MQGALDAVLVNKWLFFRVGGPCALFGQQAAVLPCRGAYAVARVAWTAGLAGSPQETHSGRLVDCCSRIRFPPAYRETSDAMVPSPRRSVQGYGHRHPSR